MKYISQIFKGLLLILIGCSNNQKHDNNIADYYFKPDWFEKPIVYEYLYKTKDTSYFMYHEFKKINSNELEITITGEKLNVIAKKSYLYKDDGVYVKEYFTNMYWSNKGYLKEQVFEDKVFPYNFSTDNICVSNTIRLSDKMNSKRTTNLKFENFDQYKFNGKNITVARFSGVSEGLIYGNEEYNDLFLKYDDVLLFGENIGIVYSISKNNDRINELTLKRRITIEEFEKIKNAR